MKPIEKGCKAIIVGSKCIENSGKIVTVLNFLGNVTSKFEGVQLSSEMCDYWEVDQKILFTSGAWEYAVSESQLQRIDGNDNEIIETKKELEVKA